MARSTDDQLYSVAKLIGYCEAIAASGLLGEFMEIQMRRHIAQTLIAFDMEPHQDEIKTVMETASILFTERT